MAKCGINTVKVGKSTVPYSKVAAALNAAEKAETYSEAVEAGYLKLPTSVDITAWEKWFKRIHLISQGGNITEHDISGFVDKKSTRLKKLLNMEGFLEHTKGDRHFNLLPETVNIISSYKRRLIEQGALLTNEQIDVLIDAIENVIWANNATQKANATRNNAIRALNTKLGADNKQFYPIFRKVLSIPFQSVKDPEMKEKYLRVLGALADRTAVLNLKKLGEVLDDANEILANVQEIPADIEEKQKFKNDPEKHAFWKAKFLKTKLTISKNLTKEEQLIAKEVQKLLNDPKDLDSLNHVQLRLLAESVENLNGEVVTGVLNDIIWTVKAHKLKTALKPVVMGIQPANLTNAAQRFYGKLKSSVTNKTAMLEIIRSAPKHVIDEIFGSKQTVIFDETFGYLAAQSEQMELANLRLTEITEKMEGKHAKVYKDINKRTKSIYKLKIYEKLLEHLSNPEQYSPMEYVQRILLESGEGIVYTEHDAKILNELIEEYAVNGKFDKTKLTESLSEVEKEVLLHNQNVNEAKIKKVLFVSGVLRGERVDALVNYSPSNTLSKDGTEQALEDLMNRFQKGTSVKSSAGHKRTTGGKAPLISLDVMGDVLKSAKQVNVEYFMTEPIRVTQRALNLLTEELADENAPALVRQGAAAIKAALTENIESNLGRKAQQYSKGDKVMSFLLKHGYAAQLASLPRAVAEFLSNVSFAIINSPLALIKGVGLSKVTFNQQKGQSVLEALKSKQISKLYGKGNYSSKFVEGSFFDYEAKKVKKATSPTRARMERVRAILFDNKAAKFPSWAADRLLSAPDKVVAIPLYFGTLSSKFKELTGQEIDFDRVSEQDEAYMEKYATELSEAVKEADHISIQAGASNNAYTGISKLDKDPNAPMYKQAYKAVSGYLMRFMIYEASTFRTGLLSAMGSGRYGRFKGAQIMGAALIRLSLYFPLYTMMSAKFAYLLGFDDDGEEEDFSEAFVRDFVGGIATMMTQRGLTSLPRVPINMGLEYINEEYLEGLRNGKKYDSYKHSMVFSLISDKDFRYGKSFADLLLKFTGPARPLLKDLEKIFKDTAKIKGAKTKSEEDAALESAARRMMLTLGGHSGFIPIYKDMIREYNKQEYLAKKKTGKRGRKKKSLGSL